MKQQWITLGLAAVLIGCAAVDVGILRHATPAAVNAEERGTSVALSYQPGQSTWGPTNVYGTAVLWPLEGVATLSVHLLPHLQHGDRYVWWVANSHSGASMRLGTFNTSDAGDIFLDTFLAGSLPHGADVVMVTIAHSHDALKTPGSARTLYGNITLQGRTLPEPPPIPGSGQTVKRPSTSSTDTAGSSTGADGTGTYRAPVVLPMTGGAQLLHARRQHMPAVKTTWQGNGPEGRRARPQNPTAKS